MKKSKIIKETEKTIIDSNTGEVKSHYTENVLQFPKEPPFIKLYLDDISKLYELPKNSTPLLMELIKNLNYEGYINLNPHVKKTICHKTGLKLKTLSNYLSSLINKGIFVRIGTGVYQPDPNLFGRGEWKSIYKKRELWLKVQYNNGERKITGSLSN